MAKATLKQVREYISVPGNLVSLTELKELSEEDKNYFRELVGPELEA